jgi:hypothetical protein
MSRSTSTLKRGAYAWLHSDLVGIPVTLAVFGIIAGSVALYLVIGKVAGLFVGKLLFIVATGGLLGLILLLEGRHGETTVGVSRAPAGGPRRVLVVANEGLEQAPLCEAVRDPEGESTREAMIVAPVVAPSRLHALTDDVDAGLNLAQERLDTAVATLRRAGITAAGRAAIGAPITGLLDGLREFPATEVVMLRGGEHGWEDAEKLAGRLRTELGVHVTVVQPTGPARAA